VSTHAITLLDALSARLGGQSDNKGRLHADCPFCGAAGSTRSHRPAYHFYLYEFGATGYVCWACGAKGGLPDLARHLDMTADGYAVPAVAPLRTNPTPPWAEPGALDRYTAWVMDAERQRQIVQQWQRYKPLTPDTIRRERLAYGKLTLYDEERGGWYASRYPRLLVPLIVANRLVGFRGRAVERGDTGPKWLTASTSQQALLGLNDVQPGATVIWCENLIDRLLAQQDEPGVVAVASGGLTWQPGWLTALARRQPSRVIVWFDHDLAGNGGGAERPAMLAAWEVEQRQRRRERNIPGSTPLPTPPAPRGPLLVAELKQAGVPAELYQWTPGTPWKGDLGWFLNQGA